MLNKIFHTSTIQATVWVTSGIPININQALNIALPATNTILMYSDKIIRYTDIRNFTGVKNGLIDIYLIIFFNLSD